ncbi:hypothetical protein, variant 6 [Phytophthora nicotianae CJ01A1]|uniref:Uncharacterized protein n=4 Tax=Phytophthora nicotianae TaxID=4792 RepID=W2J4U6_PHYNI|nr:hypothetical protein, variant 4 [Phytophthora nicotianae]ETP17908.1 hypothetical protein, variant 4 [Phytophthora nicotianae CJ01A1]ETK88037.1 hypothetical protein, variant 5 [Phytophthora nicotianae]ETK88038.1 hypothetical protein, variant 6 [Phytophthora nicotianae]ETL41454.1 hypothetical protein, variant 4 [Phytophthora nicotianae]
MGKEELLDALAGLPAAASIEDLRAQFAVVHEALSDIQRKRWKFLEDACSVVLRQVFSLVSNDEIDGMSDVDSREFTISTQEGVDLCLQFIEPLIHSTVLVADVLDDEQEAVSQRGVVIAALLYLFAKVSKDSEIKSRLVAKVLLCGVEIHVILATLRFREELIECRRALLPSYESDSEAESELDSDDDEGLSEHTGEFESEDTQWITEQVAKAWGLTKYRYFLQTSGQEYSFTAWSYRGIGNLVHAMITDEQHGVNVMPAAVSPFSWLFHIAAYAHYMIHSKDHQERLCGLEVLRVICDVCPNDKLTLDAERGRDENNDTSLSFRQQAASFRKRDWMSPLIQVITNAMVAFPEVNDRSSTLAVLKELVSKIAVTDRFWILRDLIIKCPYGNVAAVLVDFVRNDAVQSWSSSETNSQSRTYPAQTTSTNGLNFPTLSLSLSLFFFCLNSFQDNRNLLAASRYTDQICRTRPCVAC